MSSLSTRNSYTKAIRWMTAHPVISLVFLTALVLIITVNTYNPTKHKTLHEPCVDRVDSKRSPFDGKDAEVLHEFLSYNSQGTL